MSQQESSAIIIEPDRAVDAAIIWMHGLGADGNDFVPVVAQLDHALTEHVRFVFPHAPMRPVTINAGMVMRAWYDIANASLARDADEPGIRNATSGLHGLIDQQIALGVPAQRIVAAGFSQGGAIALFGGLRYPRTLAGILALSTYLPLPETMATERAPENNRTPIFMAHGTLDPVIPLALAETSYAQIRELGYPAEFQRYAMPHAVCGAEISAASAWLTRVLA